MTTCLNCNKVLPTEQGNMKIPLCSTLCRSKYYHKMKRRVLIDMCIRLEDFEGIKGLTVGTINRMGYEVRIKPRREQYLNTPASTL